MDALLQNLRYAIRALRRQPGFAPTDPPAFGLGIMVLALVSLAAAPVPALRAE